MLVFVGRGTFWFFEVLAVPCPLLCNLPGNPRNPRDGVSGQWNGTGGLVYNSTVAMPTATWTDRAVVQLWSGSHWASQMFYVDSHEPASTSAAGGGGGGTIKYTNGGFQDARAVSPPARRLPHWSHLTDACLGSHACVFGHRTFTVPESKKLLFLSPPSDSL